MTGWRRTWARWRRQNRFLIGLYLGLLLLVGLGYTLFATMRSLPPEELTNRLLTFLLWWFDLTLIAVVLFVLLRNFFKLALERHHGLLGARFRTKLLLSYLVLIVVPTGLLFVLGVGLLSHAAASWFSAPVDGMAEAGARIAGSLRDETEARVRRDVAIIARELGKVDGERARTRELARLQALLGTQLVGWYRDGAAVLELVDPRQRELQRLPPLDPGALAHGGIQRERFGGTIVVRAWEPIGDGSVAVTGEAVSPAVMHEQGRLAAAAAAYERLKLERPTITATTVLGFGALALVVVFAAMWLGLHLSRRFTEPLLALVATTERVAGGDDLIEVPIPAEDEVGLLVSSFNAMVKRLRERDEELSATVRRLDAVLGAVRTGVLTLDAERAKVAANPAAAALLGMPHLADERVPLEALGVAGLGKLADVIRSAEGVSRGSLTIYPGGIARAIEIAVVPLGSPGRPEGWVVALEDLTQLVRAQRQAAWSEAARRIAHQIKNPLTPIRLAAERIARHVERKTPDLETVVPQGCRAIVEHVQAMQEMVDAFARYAKLPPMSRRPVVVSDLVRQVVSLYDGVRNDVAVRFLDGTASLEVVLDPEQFRQVLTNLIDNAVEASPATATVTVASRSADGQLEVEVTDQGSGLGVEDPELLFQPFFSTKGRGSGVGLAVVQRIVTDHGGIVRLEPNQPNGVRAVVRMPGGEA
jgi:two-component system, NtrC family, nitrogen regulation sensor histidine kinase NtrY